MRRLGEVVVTLTSAYSDCLIPRCDFDWGSSPGHVFKMCQAYDDDDDVDDKEGSVKMCSCNRADARS